MRKYQRYLSKSLIIFSSIFMILLFFIESSTGFKIIFNFTSQFFAGFRVEEIRGNWRDFTLKNINYDTAKISIQAKSIHLVLEMTSLFNISTIFKKIETNDLKIFLKQDDILDTSKVQEVVFNTIKKSIFFKNPIIFQKIYSDKISFKTSKINILISHFLSGVKLINNNVTFFSTFIDNVNIITSTNQLKNNLSNKNSFTIHHLNENEKMNNFLYFLSTRLKFFIPFNLHFKFIEFKKVNLISDNISNFFSVALIAKVENNILTIKKLEICSHFVNIQSSGTVIFSRDNTILNIKNKIFAPRFHNKIINILFKAILNKKFIFQLKSDDVHKINIGGSILLDNEKHSFYIDCKSNNLFFSIKKKTILEVKKFHAIVKGKLNNYSLSLQHTFKIHGIPSIFMYIKANGNLRNIFLKKMNFLLLKKNIVNVKKAQSENSFIYNPSLLKFMGKINIIGQDRNNMYHLCIPKISLDSIIMQKKLSISGSLCYRNFDILETSGINISAGKNILNTKGSIGEKINIHTLINASNLDYFFPNLKGIIKVRSHLYGNNMFPKMTNMILGKNLNWENKIFLKSIKIFSNINTKNKSLGQFSFDVKKFHFYSFQINSLHIEANWHNNKKKFSFLFNSPVLYTNIISNIIIDNKTKNWHGKFKHIYIKTILGTLTSKKISFFYDNHKNSQIKKFYVTKIKKFFSSFLQKTKKNFFNISDKDLLNFKITLFIKAQLKWMLGENISYGKILLTGDHVRLKRKNQDVIFFEDIDHFKISLNLIDHDLQTKWMIKKSITALDNQNISGQLNLIDLYNTKNIEGQFIISNFPISIVNFFTTNFKQVKGTFGGSVNFSGSLYHPKILANIRLKNIFIKSDNILKYIILFFPYFSGKTDKIKINQEIIMKKSHVFFIFNESLSHSNNTQWNLFFNSKEIGMVIFHKIKVEFSSQLNLHYSSNKYDLIGYIKFSFFYFKINEKNFTI